MANTLNNVKEAAGIIAKAAAGILQDQMQFGNSIAKAPESDFKGKNGYSAGDTIYISKPARFVPQTTFDITSSQQDVTEEKVALTLDTISTVGINLSTEELAYKMDLASVIERVVKPAASAIAQNVEQRFLQKATQATYNSVGTAGSNTFAPDDILAAREKLNKFLAPKDDMRTFLFDSTAGRAAVNARKGLFQAASEIGNQYKMGEMGMADGFSWKESELAYVHTLGADVTGVQINAASTPTGSSSIVVDGLVGTITKGTVFTIAGVYAVHPVTKQTYSFLQQFVATADLTNDGTLSISPTIYGSGSGSLQNVSALPADNAALTFVGGASTSYTQSLAFHKEAFRMVSVPLVMPINAEFAAQETVGGYTVAVVRDFDVKTRKMITRLDFLGGLVAVRPEHAVRVTA